MSSQHACQNTFNRKYKSLLYPLLRCRISDHMCMDRRLWHGRQRKRMQP